MKPQFDDPIQSQRAQTVQIASLTVLLGSLLFLILSTFFVSVTHFNFGLAGSGVLVSFAGLGLARAGRPTAASYLVLASLLAFAIAATVYGGGSRSSAYDVFFISILFAGFLFGPRAAVAVGILAVLAALGVARLESNGTLPEARFEPSPGMRWATLLSSLIAASGAMWLGLKQTQRSLEAVRRSEERYRLVTDNASDFVWTLDSERVFTFASPSIESILGFKPEEIVGTRWHQGMLVDGSPDVATMVQEAIAERSEVIRYEAEHVRKDGTPVWCEVSNKLLFDEKGRLLGVTGGTRLIAKRKQVERRQRELEAQFREAQKLEAVGKLAGGIAHDFNNYLTVIIGNAESLALDSEADKLPQLTEIRDAAERSAELTHQLLAFSRRQILQPISLDLNEMIRTAERLLRRILGEDVALETRCATGLGSVRADASQIQQIILNLAVNARTAMPNGGKLTLETGNVYLDDDYAASHPEMEPGRYVLLAVSDSGAGIEQEVVTRIFEPFYTTRQEGSGLGLSTVHGIVKQSGGSIHVQSEVGQGTTFKIYLPRIDELAEDPFAHLTASLAREERGSETVLVVEDLEMLRRLMRNLLEDRGYRVLTAQSGEEALEIAEAAGGQIDLLLTDIVLTGITGVEVARALEERFSLPVLFMSGFTENGVVHRGVLDPGVLLLQKPFTAATLFARVREALDR